MVGERRTNNETAQQYTQRILGYVEGKEPLEVQAATPGKLERLIKGLSMTKLRERPAADKWSVSEIVAHLDDAEIVTGFRMKMILGAPGASIAAYDQNSWVTSGHYEKRDPRKSVEQFSCSPRSQSCSTESLAARASGNTTECIPSAGRKRLSLSSACAAGHDINHLQADRADLARETEVGGAAERAFCGVRSFYRVGDWFRR